MNNYIANLRKSHNLSRDNLAKQLGMSRPSLAAIERGDKDVTVKVLRKISEIFETPLSLLWDEDTPDDSIIISSNYKTHALKKFHNLLLQCIKYGADDDGRITKTKLAKLVYLCDFASYYKFLEPISGLEYQRLEQGPVAMKFFDIIDNNQSISVEYKGSAIMVSLNEQPEKSILSCKEEDLVKDVCKKWLGVNTQEVVDFVHNQIPWKVCRDYEVIPYSLINNEDPDNVY